MDYIILRNIGSERLRDPFDLPGNIATSTSELPAKTGSSRFSGEDSAEEIKLETADLSVKEAADLARDPNVQAAASSFVLRPIEPVEQSAEPVNPSDITDAPWGLDAVGALDGASDGAGTSVAIIDSGIDDEHPAFQDPSLDLIQEDFTGDGNGDKSGHGTHCAGTILGRDVGGVRIGVAPGVSTALIARVFGESGGGDTAMLFRAMKWAFDENADVISMSLGYDFPGQVSRLKDVYGFTEAAAVSMALDNYRDTINLFEVLVQSFQMSVEAGLSSGSVIVAAAGNENNQAAGPRAQIRTALPAAAKGIIAVGALGSPDTAAGDYKIANFSNTLPQVAGPGVDILSAHAGGGLTYKSGTSMATPHVAGVAALWWQAMRASSSRVSASRVVPRILSNATRARLQSIDEADVGEGLVQAPSINLV